MKLKNKLFLFFLPLLVLLPVMFGWGGYEHMQLLASQAQIKKMVGRVEALGADFEALTSETENHLTLLMTEQAVTHFLKVQNETLREAVYRPLLMEAFANHLSAFPDYQAVMLLGGNQDFWVSVSHSGLSDGILSQWSEYIYDSNRKKTLVQNEFAIKRFATNEESHLFMIRSIPLSVLSEPDIDAPYLVLVVGMGRVAGRLREDIHDRDSFVWFAGPNHDVLLKAGNKWPGDETARSITALRGLSGESRKNWSVDSGMYHVEGRFLPGGMQVLNAIPQSALREAGALGWWIFLVTVLGILLLGMGLYVLLERILSRPLQALIETAQQLETEKGTLDDSVIDRDVWGKGELDRLVTRFQKIARNTLYMGKRERHFAYHDSLTGLPNRLMLRELLDSALTESRQEKTLLAVFFLDIDDLKQVNDSIGHHMGDELIKEAANRLAKAVRGLDYVARIGGVDGLDRESGSDSGVVSRLGGDEFVVLLPGVASLEEPEKISRRILDVFNKPFTIGQQEVIAGISIGIALFPKDGESPDVLLKNADIAMYQAKKLGKNNFQFYDSSMDKEVLERISLENALRGVLKNNQLSLFYQPIVDRRTGLISGAEALVRWNHPIYGEISPEMFIPIAETSGLINEIGEWVLRQACLQLSVWQSLGYEQIRLSVNISGLQLSYQNLPELIQQVLEASGAKSENLDLELTESSVIELRGRSVALFERLKRLGVSLSMDDFGTGYSALSYLLKLPFDRIKIDQSFVAELGESRDSSALVSVIVAMARTMQVKVVAEGVETEAQRDFLRVQGCDYLQGYLFSRPLSGQAFTELLNQAPVYFGSAPMLRASIHPVDN